MYNQGPGATALGAVTTYPQRCQPCPRGGGLAPPKPRQQPGGLRPLRPPNVVGSGLELRRRVGRSLTNALFVDERPTRRRTPDPTM